MPLVRRLLDVLWKIYPIHLILCSYIGAYINDMRRIYAQQPKFDFDRVDKHANIKACMIMKCYAMRSLHRVK